MADKDTFFCNKNLLNCRGKLLDISTPIVMGILNITENSFFDGGSFHTTNEALKQTEKMLEEGAGIIDIGACSTKPGSLPPSAEIESKKITEIIQEIIMRFPETIISADTYRASVAEKAIEAGASIINDISGGTLDDIMFQTVAQLKVPYILMHIKGTPLTMQENPHYENLENEVLQYFVKRTNELRNLGVSDIIIDPGFGFGKNLGHNFQLLRFIKDLKILDYPILAGISRKSMINKVLKTKPSKALNGTTVLNTIALMNGAKILRVHGNHLMVLH